MTAQWTINSAGMTRSRQNLSEVFKVHGVVNPTLITEQKIINSALMTTQRFTNQE